MPITLAMFYCLCHVEKYVIEVDSVLGWLRFSQFEFVGLPLVWCGCPRRNMGRGGPTCDRPGQYDF
ncbi:MAG: hypothetical protein HC771_15115 [Synechococcales cyanobacterium CRU_2_2]|nr:hypothetical protein [Synechococcales cyanobacterium CRU_2_2]